MGDFHSQGSLYPPVRRLTDMQHGLRSVPPHFNLMQTLFYHAPALNLAQKDTHMKADVFILKLFYATCPLNNEGVVTASNALITALAKDLPSNC